MDIKYLRKCNGKVVKKSVVEFVEHAMEPYDPYAAQGHLEHTEWVLRNVVTAFGRLVDILVSEGALTKKDLIKVAGDYDVEEGTEQLTVG